jgi:hypothetical protein
MEVPIVNLIMEGFLTGYERQAKKEEKEEKSIIAGINPVLLQALCTRYDNKTGEYPEHEHEGAAVLEFYELLKKEVKNMKKKDEKLADSRLGKLGIEPKIFLFDLNIAPFRAIIIAETRETRVTIRAMLDDILGFILTTIIHEKATRLREELRRRGIYGVAICDIRERYNLPRGRTIAKGRLWKHLKQQGAK